MFRTDLVQVSVELIEFKEVFLVIFMSSMVIQKSKNLTYTTFMQQKKCKSI